jgi:outer membrane protein OmpA-like peptidoglycan-associated protein
MKRISCILFLVTMALRLSAQLNDEKKPSTLAFHVFYNDFKTAQLIRTTSLNNVLTNGKWSNIANMQMGIGFNYLKGIGKHIDFVSTIDGSRTDYLYRNGTTNGSNAFLLDANAGLNLKLLTDRHTIVPYLSAGAGVSLYKGTAGFYIPLGAGIQVNLFNDAFIFTSMQYRRAISTSINDHFQYAVGIGADIGKKKKIKALAIAEKALVQVAIVAPTEVKIPVKDIMVTVTDEQTGLPLPGVEVAISGPDGRLSSLSNASGQVSFKMLKEDNYTVSGMLNGISTLSKPLVKADFDIPGQQITVSISHNDPRFTLTGSINNKNTHSAEAGVIVTIANVTQGNSASIQNQSGDGTFTIQLAGASDFIVSGKKAGYISNIERVSTKGLNRNTTLYVKLELDMEKTVPDKNIMLKNIYYDKGSSTLRPGASSDLEKLVTFLKDNPTVTIEIDSYTDSRGSNSSNLKLSQARAQQVVTYLAKNNISKARLIARGFGETKLVNGCTNGVKCTEAQHEQNRRTEFKVTGN